MAAGNPADRKRKRAAMQDQKVSPHPDASPRNPGLPQTDQVVVDDKREPSS